MLLNYTLLTITAVLSIVGFIGAAKGGTFSYHPFRAISAAIVFVITLIATLMGIEYINLKIMIENALGG
jgi:hypothetical protein